MTLLQKNRAEIVGGTKNRGHHRGLMQDLCLGLLKRRIMDHRRHPRVKSGGFQKETL